MFDPRDNIKDLDIRKEKSLIQKVLSFFKKNVYSPDSKRVDLSHSAELDPKSLSGAKYMAIDKDGNYMF